jgi:hypothetical protein
MIATVRIAPVERWCETAKHEVEKCGYVAKQAGRWIGIELNSMSEDITPPHCGGLEWTVTEASQRSLVRSGVLRTLPEEARMRICEHRLEID